MSGSASFQGEVFVGGERLQAGPHRRRLLAKFSLAEGWREPDAPNLPSGSCRRESFQTRRVQSN